MDFGVFDHLDASGVPLEKFYENRLRLIEAYDRSGFYAYHLAEHHVAPIGMAPSPNVFLSAVAQRTRRLRFGALVYALPLYHPLRLAEEIAMLDQMSGGRLEIGFGRGASPIEIEFFQQDADDAEADYARKFAPVLEALETGEMTFADGAPPYDRATLQVRALQRPHPPLWYGVHSRSGAERAARQKANVVSLDGAVEAQTCFNAYREAWVRLHHAPPDTKMGLSRFVVVAQTDKAAKDIARRAYPKWHRSFTFLSSAHGRQAAHPRPSQFDDLAREGKGIAGDPRSVAAALREELITSGANYFAGQFAFGDMTEDEIDESVSLFTERVAPELRAL